MKQTTKSDTPNKPNPQAVAELYERLIWFLAKREIKKRTQENNQHRAHWIQAPTGN